MSYCLNPHCRHPADLVNANNRICRHCGSSLVIRGRYRITKRLGEGGFAKTFELVDEQGSFHVLKILTDSNPKAVALFQREALVLGRLQHPGIPKVDLDAYFTFFPRNINQPVHCLLMEKIEGLNLEEWLKSRLNQPISQNQAITWLKQLCEILHQVHQQQYFHRDIKPSNIMLRPNGQLALIDFGTVREVTGTYLAKVGGGGHKVTGIVSPGYTPPEQANGKAVPQSDFFALGRTFVFLLTGTDPNDFPESPVNGELIWQNHAQQISPALAQLIDYLMAPFPGNRPQNTQVIQQRLVEVEHGVPMQLALQTAAHSASPRQSLPPRLAVPVTPITVPSRSKSKSRRRSGRVSATQRKKITRLKLKPLIGLLSLVVALGCATLLFTEAGTGLYQLMRAGINSNARLASVEAPARAGSRTLQETPSRLQASLVNQLSGHLGGVNAVAISPDGNTIAGGSVDKTIKIWNLATGELLETLRDLHEIWAIAYSPDGRTLASSSGDNTIKLWDLGTGTLKATLAGHSSRVLTLAFNHDGSLLASGSADHSIKLWDAIQGVEKVTFKGHSDWVNAVAFSPDGQTLASGSVDTTIKLWNLSQVCLAGQPCEPVHTLNSSFYRVQTLAFSPDGKILVSGSGDGNLNVWSLAPLELQRTLRSHMDTVNTVAISPNGWLMASGGGSLDPTVHLWDLKTGELLDTLKGHSDTVRALAMSPNGQILTSASADYTINIWRMQSGLSE